MFDGGQEYCNDSIFSKSVQLFAYTKDIDNIRRSWGYATAGLIAIEREFAGMGLTVDEEKLKYMLSTSRDIWSDN